jgi:NitT/TauT family transport system ATP-binding protein
LVQPLNEKGPALKSKNLLHLENVYKSYGPKRILDNIDLSVAAGELCTVVGPSGCGKSTLLRIIVGQEQATEGDVIIDSKSASSPDSNRGIVYQKYSLYPYLSVLDNVLLGRRLNTSLFQWHRRKDEFTNEAMDFLGRVRMKEHANKYPFELSGGMQQRVSIVQTLIMRPKIVLMDEPFGALDPGTREDAQVFLLELWEEFKMTIFFVTHDLEEAAYLGTRILVLSQHYKDDRDGKSPRGAKIVADHPLTRKASATSVKSTKEFGEFVQQIRAEGFDPLSQRHVREFNLQHEDSFQTLTTEEMRRDRN